jgi:hypothetical protein
MKVLTILGDNLALSEDEGQAFPTVRAAVLYSTVSADHGEVLARWGLGCLGDVFEGERRVDCNSSDVVPLDLPVELLTAYFNAAGDPETMRLVSPMDHLQYVTVPIQIHYGALDGLEYSGTPPEWSIDLSRALLEAGKTVKLVKYEGQRHSFVNEAWYSFMDSIVKFFNQNVKNVQ